ncbi:MAG: hypothetical protein Pars92KO_32530 [Parasphingorhabdus sp.]
MNDLKPYDGNLPVTSLGEWTLQGERLAADHRNLMWSIAAWLEQGVREFGDRAQAIALVQFGKSRADIKLAMDLSKRFPEGERWDGLTYAHHAAVANLVDQEAAQILVQAQTNGLSVTATKKAVNAIRESQGGDVFQKMMAIPQDELLDDWWSKIQRLWNRCPNGPDGRAMFLEAASEADGGIMQD